MDNVFGFAYQRQSKGRARTAGSDQSLFLLGFRRLWFARLPRRIKYRAALSTRPGCGFPRSESISPICIEMNGGAAV
jgi:hypothetical protein